MAGVTFDQCAKKLNKIGRMPYNWNGNGAEQFNKSLIDRSKKILSALPVEPEIYPTANDSIQMEYKKVDGSYLEFEIFENKTIMFKISATGKESYQRFYEIEQIAREVEKFYK